MLSRISTYISNRKNQMRNYFSGAKHGFSSAKFCCISITPQEVSLVLTQNINARPTLQLCNSYPYKNEIDLAPLLSNLVKNHNLKNVPCSLILQPEDYQLLITDTLPVTETEFQDAIRWKVKDLVRFPMNDVVIDRFVMPKIKTGVNKIMIVAAQMSKLELMRNRIQKSGFNLKFIDIPELALRNIVLLYSKNDKTNALIYVQENTIQLLFIEQQQIYISRLLKIALNNLDDDTLNQGIERLANEIQRSYDYFQSLWDKPIPSDFLFASTKIINKGATDLLAQRIRTPIEIIDIKDVIVCQQPISLDKQGKFLPIIGGAVREAVEHVTAS